MFILEVWGEDLQYVGREHWGHLSRRKWVILIKNIQKNGWCLWNIQQKFDNFSFVPPSILHCLDPPCPPWEKKSPAWSIPDQIRDVRIFLSGLPRPRPLSSRWSYPGRGQITFEKIIENSEMGIWSLVSFSFSFVIKTLQTLLEVFPIPKDQFWQFHVKDFLFLVFIFFICLDFCLISFGSCYKDGLFPKAVHRQSPRVLARP